MEFRNRILEDNPSTSVQISQVSSQGAVLAVDELRSGKKTVKTIDEVMLMKKEKDYDGYPPALDNMLEKRLLFKINVKSTNISANDRDYIVMNVFDDLKLFDSNQPKGVPDDSSLNENMDVRLKNVQSRST
ncbi:hypothetical protein PIB30_082724 [Stylosanthes scabra]|uniref:Uncharacterized protein n=1 Tax=Stylosanthes scabra TaxID=79078 RepID=A0ABU6SSD2_9FABA|nr:hypothetical protein [Stylosanthes scabra]